MNKILVMLGHTGIKAQLTNLSSSALAFGFSFEDGVVFFPVLVAGCTHGCGGKSKAAAALNFAAMGSWIASVLFMSVLAFALHPI